MYQGYRDMKDQDRESHPPKFLGVQQEAVCPYALRSGTVPEERSSEVPILEPTLFRSKPTEDLYQGVEKIL